MRPLLLPLLLLAGCGYSTGSMMPAGARSVAVPLAVNSTWYRHAEVVYTREVARELARHPGVTLRGPGEADAILRTRVASVPRIGLIDDEQDEILEGGMLVEVRAVLEDARTGAVIIPEMVIVRRAEYIIPRGETIQSALEEALVEAARDTVVRVMAHGFLVSRL